MAHLLARGEFQDQESRYVETECLDFFSVFFCGPLTLGYAFLSMHVAFVHLILCLRYTMYLHTISRGKKL